MPETPRIVVEPHKVYHIINRGNDYQPIFQDSQDYLKFLEFLVKYVCNVGAVIAYALMPNHFHLICQMNKETDIPLNLRKNKNTLGNTFGHLQNAYAKYYNHRHRHIGSLFEKGFERHEIKDRDYLRNCIIYLHLNSTKHRIVRNFQHYPWTSFPLIIAEDETALVDYQLHFELFGNKENFIEAHQNRDVTRWESFLEV
jgi:REP element-mobilizing transposase RayT